MTDAKATPASDEPAAGKAALPESTGGGSNGGQSPGRRAKSGAAAARPADGGSAAPLVKRLLAGLVVVVVIGAVVAAGAYFGRQWSQQRQQEMQQIQEQLAAQRSELQSLRESRQRDARVREEEISALRQTLTAVQQRLESHNKRLLSISGSDRSDWRLAEAEYLLQLANQRLVIERDTRNAEALLRAADEILRDLGDIDLYPVRQGINRDLAALKLAPDVDREGIYLRLAALAGQIESLPVFPTLPSDPRPGPDAATDDVAAEQAGTWLEVLKGSLRRALDKVSDYIQVRHHEQPLEPLLPPDSEAYLQQNLRLMLERAQLALLREEPLIYRQSLQQARQWLARYYPLVEKRQVFDAELAELQEREIVQELPDISQSLEQLQAYIERLHQLKPIDQAVSGDKSP